MEVAVFVQGIRFELIGLGFDQLLEICIVSDGDEGLHVELKTQRWGKADVRTGSKVKRSARQFSVDVVFLSLPIDLLLNHFYPLCILYLIGITRPNTHINVRSGSNTQGKVYIVVIRTPIVNSVSSLRRVRPMT